jgi:GT2 family glycosyltransferase
LSGLEATVVVPTYKDWDALQLCLDALAAQTAGTERFEVIVADNNADPGPPAGLRLPPNARIVHVPEPGSYSARNAALREARGEVLFFTDSDCRPEPEWIAAGLARMGAAGELDRVAGHVQLHCAGPRWNLWELYDRSTWLRQQDYARAGWAATANLVARRAAFARVGPFDAKTYSGADREWNMRAQRAGGRIEYAGEVRVLHPARASFAELAKKQRRTYGGRHALRAARGWSRFAPPLHYLLPPMKAARRVLRQPELAWRHKPLVFLVAWWLRVLGLWERTRLVVRGAEARRG